MIQKYIPLHDQFLQGMAQPAISAVPPRVGRTVTTYMNHYSSTKQTVCPYISYPAHSLSAGWVIYPAICSSIYCFGIRRIVSLDTSHLAAHAFDSGKEDISPLTHSPLRGHTLSQEVGLTIKPLYSIFQAIAPAKAFPI